MFPRLAKSLSLLSFALAISACVAPPVTSKETGASATSPSPQVRQATENADFRQWPEVGDFMDQMIARHGFLRPDLEALFSKVRYVDSAVQLMKPAPSGRPKDWRAYRARFIEPVRVKAGVEFWNKYAETLARAEAIYGVPAEIIVGILGVETLYGRHTGKYRVMDAITTLAFAYPDTGNRISRMNYFRGELENILLLARESGLDPFSLSGSYAGAIGWPQFMPGSIRRYAIDFDGDKIVDLRNSPVDAVGSIANYLAQHGWKTGEPVVFPATIASSSDEWRKFLNQGLVAKFPPEELAAAGVIPVIQPPANLLYGLVDLQNGEQATEYWLASANFFAITQYNRSYFYAMAVFDLGQAVKATRN